MKRLALILMVASLVLVGGPASAAMCTVDDVPAATLLLPYFEVDLNSAAGVNTVFSINNASAAATLAHVTLWTDWSQPTIDFDVFLTGYDVVVVNLRDLFENGNIPITADDQSDPADTISPDGGVGSRPDGAHSPGISNPEWDGSFPDCQNFFPFFNNPVVSGDNFDRLVQGHTGQPVAPIGGGCLGADFGDNVARGYITIDDANFCSTDFANDPGYFGGGSPTAVASNDNQLWGDYFYIDPANNFAQGENLVHIEAEGGFVGSDNGYTFYSRYTAANEDNREPLGTTWAARYLNNALFTGGTDYVVWRDSTSAEDRADAIAGGFVCGGPTAGSTTGPSWFPLNETEVIAFDDFENAAELCFTGPGGVISPPDQAQDPACFPLETQRVPTTDLGYRGIESPWGAGWMFLNLNVGTDAPVDDFDPVVPETAQSYVLVTHSASGLFSAGLQAIELTSACDAVDFLLTENCDPTTTPPGACQIPEG